MRAFVERLAKVVSVEIGSFFSPEECQSVVLAILREMRESVTEEMLQAMEQSWAYGGGSDHAAFCAALDAAMGEKP